MNTHSDIIYQTSNPRVSEEGDIPNEGNSLSQDERLNHVVPPSMTSYYDRQPIVTGSQSVLHSTYNQTPATEPRSYLIPEELSKNAIPVVESTIYHQTIPTQNFTPVTTTTTTTQAESYALQREIPQTIPIVESTIYQQTLPTQTITATPIIQHQTQIPLTETVTTKKDVVIESTIPQQGILVNEVESQHLEDSMRLEKPSESPSYKSRWDQQQFELANLRYENHQTFENWETNRAIFVNDRLNIMNDLLAGMDRTVQWFDVGVEKTILFFKERESQELQLSKAVKHGLTQVGEHFEKGDHPEILESLTQGLKESDAFHAREKRNSEILGMFIKKDILDWILLPSEKNYKQQAAALRVPLLAHKKKMDHLAAKRQRAYHKYFKAYDAIQKNGKPSSNDDNIFKRQLKYSLAAREELRMLRLYSEQGLFIIGEFGRLQALRMSEVQRAFTLYLQKYTELYQNSANTPEPILEVISKSKGPEGVPNFFTVRNLLTPNNFEFLCNTLNKHDELVYADLTPFLVNFPESVDPARSSFVLREFEAVKMGNLLKKPRKCSIIATTNNNLLIVERKHEEQEIGKVKNPMQLRFTRVEEVNATEDGTMIKVVERAPGTLHTHKTKANLKFETQEEAQQFMQFVNAQTTGEV